MWRQQDLSQQVCACGMNYKKGTSVFAIVFAILSLILVILLAVALSQIIAQEEILLRSSSLYRSHIGFAKAVLSVSIVLYGLHALSCGMVIIAARTGNRFLLIPWMIFGCILGGLQLRALWITITSGVSSSGRSSVGDNPILTLLFAVIFLLLIVGFGFCVGKLYRILRAEAAARNIPGGQIQQQGFVVTYQPPPQQMGFQSPPQQMPPGGYQPQQYPGGGQQVPPQQFSPPVYQPPPSQQFSPPVYQPPPSQQFSPPLYQPPPSQQYFAGGYPPPTKQ